GATTASRLMCCGSSLEPRRCSGGLTRRPDHPLTRLLITCESVTAVPGPSCLTRPAVSSPPLPAARPPPPPLVAGTPWPSHSRALPSVVIWMAISSGRYLIPHTLTDR